MLYSFVYDCERFFDITTGTSSYGFEYLSFGANYVLVNFLIIDISGWLVMVAKVSDSDRASTSGHQWDACRFRRSVR